MPRDVASSGKTLHIEVMRSELGRARGLGSARRGSKTGLAERLTARARVPLSLWFVASVVRLEGATRADMIDWLHSPVALVLMLCLIVSVFWHMELGLRVVIEDYVHSSLLRIPMLVLQRGLCIVAAVLCVIAALRLGL